ncbi:AAA family ATPase [Candidatus Bathyarchaeota archaeon]|nr:AAA family ATPase [Candidatus Bathyarchaeota archaeon]
MRIDSIVIENVRSHTKSYVKFSEGFNCLVGGLGAGKTSILYAIDFALFGEPLGKSYDYLLREGESLGKVVLKFIANGREYTIFRGLRRRGGRISQDSEKLKLFEGSKLIAEMKNEAILEQLKAITGIDKEIFREIIWVRQEKLKEILDMTPSERKKKIDQLFGISDYEIAWTNLRPVLRWYESERESLKRDPDVTNVGEFQKRYEEAVKDLALKETELSDARKHLDEAERRLREASRLLEELKILRQRREEIMMKKNRLEAEISKTEALLSRLVNEARERKARIDELNRRLELLNNQEADSRKKMVDFGLAPDASLEHIRLHIDSILTQVSTMQGEKENVKSEIKRTTQRISSLMKESKCPLCLQDLSPEYKNRLLSQLNMNLSDYEKQLNELERGIRELEYLRRALLTTFSNLQLIQSKREEVLNQIRIEETRLNNTLREAANKRKILENLKGELADLQSKIVEFDYSKLERAQRMYDEALERYSSLKYKVQSLESQLNEIRLRLDNFRERLEIAQKKIERLNKIEKIIAFVEEARQAYRSIQPKIRRDFIKYFERVVQQIIDELTGLEGSTFCVKIDEDYTPIIESEEKYERSAMNLSGGERTFLAFAYRLGMGQLVLNLRTGRGLSILLLDEPTESLGREDGSIDRLAEILSRLKTVEQIIAVTHSEAFAEKANYVIRVEKRGGHSIVSTESMDQIYVKTS